MREKEMELRFLDGLNPGDVSVWDEMVRGAPIPDVYYRPGYVRAYHFAGEGRPVAVVIRIGSSKLLFPLLIRDLTFDGQSYSDAITPYGYGGMLLVSGPNPDSRVLQEATEELRNWAHSLGLAACTIRLHPLLDEDTIRQASEIWQEKVRVFPPSQTTAVELERWDAASFILERMSTLRRRDVKKARSALQVRVSQGKEVAEDLKIFQALYRETMLRLNADEFFYFSDKYYEHLAGELGDDFAVATAFAGDRPVGSYIFLAGARYAHYHLAGTNDEGRRNGAATLLMMAGCEWARRKGCSLLHLGGSLQPDDSLWQFKRSFHGKAFSYSYITVIANDGQYKSLASNTESPWPYAPVGRASESVLASSAPASRSHRPAPPTASG